MVKEKEETKATSGSHWFFFFIDSHSRDRLAQKPILLDIFFGSRSRDLSKNLF